MIRIAVEDLVNEAVPRHNHDSVKLVERQLLHDILGVEAPRGDWTGLSGTNTGGKERGSLTGDVDLALCRVEYRLDFLSVMSRGLALWSIVQ